MLSKGLSHAVQLTFPFGIQGLFCCKFQQRWCYSHREWFDFWVTCLMCSLVVSINSASEKLCSVSKAKNLHEILIKHFWKNVGKISILHLVWNCMSWKVDFIMNKNQKVVILFCLDTSKIFCSFMLFLLTVHLKQSPFISFFLNYPEYSSETEVIKITHFTVMLCMDFCELN